VLSQVGVVQAKAQQIQNSFGAVNGSSGTRLRRIPLWEGHTRYALEGLVDATSDGRGYCAALAAAVVSIPRSGSPVPRKRTSTL
jgi:hypothetical protein